MTTVSKFEDFLDELDRLMETKENPDQWYVVSGKQVGLRGDVVMKRSREEAEVVA